MTNLLKQRRQELNLTQKQVAEKVGIAENAYQRYEKGNVEPLVFIAIKIANALKTNVEGLWRD